MRSKRFSSAIERAQTRVGKDEAQRPKIAGRHLEQKAKRLLERDDDFGRPLVELHDAVDVARRAIDEELFVQRREIRGRASFL